MATPASRAPDRRNHPATSRPPKRHARRAHATTTQAPSTARDRSRAYAPEKMRASARLRPHAVRLNGKTVGWRYKSGVLRVSFKTRSGTLLVSR